MGDRAACVGRAPEPAPGAAGITRSRRAPALEPRQSHAVGIREKYEINRLTRSEIVIGDFETSVDDPRFVHDALRALVRAIRKYRSITIASIALNEHCRDTSLLHGLRRCGFRKIKRTIHFIAKDMGSGAPILEPTAWRVLRRDIDTW